MYYQYYRGTGGQDSREIFFNFDTTWKDASLKKEDGHRFNCRNRSKFVDYVNSEVHGRRLANL